MIQELQDLDQDQIDAPDKVAHTVRSQDDEVLEKFAKLESLMTKGTDYRKYGKSTTWLFALNLADMYVEEKEGSLEEIENDLSEAIP